MEYLAFFTQAERQIREQAGYLASQLFGLAVHIIPQNRELFFAGLGLYRARPDKGYSPMPLSFAKSEQSGGAGPQTCTGRLRPALR